MVKQELQKAKMHDIQAKDERLCMSTEHGGRKVKSVKDVCEDTKIRVACYITYQESEWLQAAYKKETMKDDKSLNRDVPKTLAVYGIKAVFDKDGVHLKGKIMLRA